MASHGEASTGALDQVTDPKTVTFERLWHVGTLNPANKWQRGHSYEGSGLSVSQHPEAWTQIARLGGHPTWELDTCGLKFVDMHALDDDDMARIRQWSFNQGFTTEKAGWELSWYDDELDAEVTMTTTDYAEVEDRCDNGDLIRFSNVSVLQPTPVLAAAVGHPVLEGDAEEQAAVLYFEREHPDVDGLWWRDRLDPDCYSAPRGVIFRHSLDGVTATQKSTFTA